MLNFDAVVDICCCFVVNKCFANKCRCRYGAAVIPIALYPPATAVVVVVLFIYFYIFFPVIAPVSATNP